MIVLQRRGANLATALILLLVQRMQADIMGSTLNPITWYKPGETNTLVYECVAQSCNDEWIRAVTVVYPSNIPLVASYAGAGDQAALLCTITTGAVTQVRWTSADTNFLFALPPDNDTNQLGAVSDGHRARLTNDVLMAPAMVSPLTITYYLQGDEWGVGAHALTNVLTLWPVPEPRGYATVLLAVLLQHKRSKHS